MGFGTIRGCLHVGIGRWGRCLPHVWAGFREDPRLAGWRHLGPVHIRWAGSDFCRVVRLAHGRPPPRCRRRCRRGPRVAVVAAAAHMRGRGGRGPHRGVVSRRKLPPAAFVALQERKRCWADRGFSPLPDCVMPPLQRYAPTRGGAVQLRGKLSGGGAAHVARDGRTGGGGWGEPPRPGVGAARGGGGERRPWTARSEVTWRTWNRWQRTHRRVGRGLVAASVGGRTGGG